LESTISVPNGFSVTSGFGAASLSPGASTTFTVRLNATAEGTFAGRVSFGNNDGNENPFDFAVAGSVAATPPPPAIQIIDNGAAGFSQIGFTNFTGQGFQNDVHYAAAGSGTAASTWTFTVTPGVYRVWVTWSEHPNRATNAKFSVLDGTTILGSAEVNQQTAPNDLSDSGAVWESVGGEYTISGSQLNVTLTNKANGFVIADAVRIERVRTVSSAQANAAFSDFDALGL
jgi:hypothetical protein